MILYDKNNIDRLKCYDTLIPPDKPPAQLENLQSLINSEAFVIFCFLNHSRFKEKGYHGMDIIQQTLKHSVWECKYHVVWIPKYRKKALYGELRKYLREIFYELAKQKKLKIKEGHMMSDCIYMLISIPPKYSVA